MVGTHNKDPAWVADDFRPVTGISLDIRIAPVALTVTEELLLLTRWHTGTCNVRRFKLLNWGHLLLRTWPISSAVAVSIRFNRLTVLNCLGKCMFWTRCPVIHSVSPRHCSYPFFTWWQDVSNNRDQLWQSAACYPTCLWWRKGKNATGFVADCPGRMVKL